MITKLIVTALRVKAKCGRVALWAPGSKAIGIASLLLVSSCIPLSGSEHQSDSSGVSHRAQAQVEKWIRTHTYGHWQFVTPEGQKILEDGFSAGEQIAASLQELLALKQGQKITLGMPLIVDEDPEEVDVNDFEAIEIVRTLEAILPLKRAGLIDDMVVVIAQANGKAYEAARQVAGNSVSFLSNEDFRNAQPNEKTGIAIEAVLQDAKNRGSSILAWIDPEVGMLEAQETYARRYVYGVLGPILKHNVDYAKGYYEQSPDGGGGYTSGGGRVTELTVRPLLNVFYPELAGFIHPLCSEFAVRLSSLPERPFEMQNGEQQYYGAIVGLMVDVFMQRGLDALAQVNLDYRFPKNPDLPSLSSLAIVEADSLLQRAVRDSRLGFPTQWPGSMPAMTGAAPPNRSMVRLRAKEKFPDPNAPVFTVNKEFETIPSNRHHVMEQYLGGWTVASEPTDPGSRRNTFSHWDFVPEAQRSMLRSLSQQELDARFNSGIDTRLIEEAMQLLVERKRELGVTISLGLPALNEGKTIEGVIRSVLPLRDAGLLDEIVLIDSNSVPLKKPNELTEDEATLMREPDGSILTDADGYAIKSGTREKAQRLGIPVFIHQEILSDRFGSNKGKGEALWKSLAVLSGDIIAWIDTDIINPSPRFVYGVLGPLLFNPDIVYVKGYYARPISLAGGPVAPSGGGRVTELTARPLLNYLYPELSGMIQPLSGEFAGRRDALRNANFYMGYGVETGLLIDLVTQYGMNALAQVDLEVREHKNQDLPSLSKMAFAITDVIFQRAAETNRLFYPLEPNRAMWRLKPTGPSDPNLPYIMFADLFKSLQTEVIGPDARRPPMAQSLARAVTVSGQPMQEWHLDAKRGRTIPVAPGGPLNRGIVVRDAGNELMVLDLTQPRMIRVSSNQVHVDDTSSVAVSTGNIAACPRWSPMGSVQTPSSWQLSSPRAAASKNVPVLAMVGDYAVLATQSTSTQTEIELISRYCVR